MGKIRKNPVKFLKHKYHKKNQKEAAKIQHFLKEYDKIVEDFEGLYEQ